VPPVLHGGARGAGVSGPAEQRPGDRAAGLRDADRAVGLRPSDRWGFWPGWVDLAWAVFALANLGAIVVFAPWETIPFHFIWISVTLLYGFRVWDAKPTSWVLGVVIVTTFLAIWVDVRRGTEPADELNEVPLMAAMFCAMVWHARRRLTAERDRTVVSEHNARLLDTQRRFLQDASHQLRTPIAIALGHAELLARELAGRPGERDIHVVAGELNRLKRLAERLLVIAASENPDFLRPEPLGLDGFVMEVLRRWLPTARRRWQLGQLDEVMVSADAERLGLAVDALLENAVQHTAHGDGIKLSVLRDQRLSWARLVVEDTGSGIPPAELGHIFDRFRSGPAVGGARGTGLGLALVRAIARGHGGEVRVRSVPGSGSKFEIVLPALAPPDDGPGDVLAPTQAGDPCGNVNLR
jgi:signal transduction histidine kinase